jgi:hypothetical protein
VKELVLKKTNVIIPDAGHSLNKYGLIARQMTVNWKEKASTKYKSVLMKCRSNPVDPGA